MFNVFIYALNKTLHTPIFKVFTMRNELVSCLVTNLGCNLVTNLGCNGSIAYRENYTSKLFLRRFINPTSGRKPASQRYVARGVSGKKSFRSNLLTKIQSIDDG